MTAGTGRPRIGLLVPSSNSTAEPEISTACPQAIVLATRVLQRETDIEAEKLATILEMRPQLPAASRLLLSAEVAAIGYACTAGSFVSGAEDDETMCRELSVDLGVPFLTASRSVVIALRALGVSRVSMATPYVPAINDLERAYLASEGVEVVRDAALGIVGNLPKGRLDPIASLTAAKQADTTEAAAVFVSCTNWPTLTNLGDWARELGKPVITSNQALAWALLRTAGVTEALPTLGALADVPLVAEMVR